MQLVTVAASIEGDLLNIKEGIVSELQIPRMERGFRLIQQILKGITQSIRYQNINLHPEVDMFGSELIFFCVSPGLQKYQFYLIRFCRPEEKMLTFFFGNSPKNINIGWVQS